FDENLYVIRMKHVDGSESEAPFKAAFMDKTEYDKLSVAGTHEIVFTFEKCRGTFKITVVSE
ncbi:MAG: hypothetical protein ILP02_01350, partial [Clostridia bacterium]|nr:hypothetical protein [Clostridia bacterium]